jgi:NAD(P)-dependent dehydrogenase (short-subunit alcohol dehydrogenase family)
VGDITRDSVVEEFAGKVFERFGRVDVLVNNAGISLIRAAEETTAAEYRRVMEVNLVAPFLLARVFGRKMLEARSGAIVNVASIAGLVAVFGWELGIGSVGEAVRIVRRLRSGLSGILR